MTSTSSAGNTGRNCGGANPGWTRVTRFNAFVLQSMPLLSVQYNGIRLNNPWIR